LVVSPQEVPWGKYNNGLRQLTSEKVAFVSKKVFGAVANHFAG
jgi:hypothetical protein